MILFVKYSENNSETYLFDSVTEARKAGMFGKDDTFFLNFSLADRYWLTAKFGESEYNKKKSRLESIAHEYDFFVSEHQPNLSWGELAEIQDWFRKNGKRYGMLEELQENCFC